MRSSRSRRRLPSSSSRNRAGRQFTSQRSGPGRSRPPLVAITNPLGYGNSASAITSSLTCGPYDSAVSMSYTPRSTARRSVARASARSVGGPHTPGPVMRMAPNPSRWTARSPPRWKAPLNEAFGPMVYVNQPDRVPSAQPPGYFRKRTANSHQVLCCDPSGHVRRSLAGGCQPMSNAGQITGDCAGALES
jgi:hypothetical protein